MVVERQRWSGLRSISLPDDLGRGTELEQPSFLERLGGETPAERQAECAICFEPLCSAQVAVLASRGGGRSCPHFLHKTCADECPREMGCPLCRQNYEEALEVPPLSSAMEWFETMDTNRNGRLEQHEVARAVAATLPVDVDVLEQVLPELWAAWGKAPDQALCFKELLGTDGLLWQLQESSSRSGPRTLHLSTETCPEFDFSNKFGWFTHWDADCSGLLEREEVIRGLVKQFYSDVSRDVCSKRLRMRQVVEGIWPMADLDANGKITLYEFCKEGGLADLILQQFKAKRCRSPKGTGTKSPTGPKSPRAPGSPRRATSKRQPQRRQSMPATCPSSLRPSPRARGAVRLSLGACDSSPCTAPETPSTDAGTDLTDAGEDDRPMLLRRISKGFSPQAARGVGRETVAQYARAELDLSTWSGPSGASDDPRQALASLYMGRPSPRTGRRRRTMSPPRPSSPSGRRTISPPRGPSPSGRRAVSPPGAATTGRPSPRRRAASRGASLWDTAPT